LVVKTEPLAVFVTVDVLLIEMEDVPVFEELCEDVSREDRNDVRVVNGVDVSRYDNAVVRDDRGDLVDVLDAVADSVGRILLSARTLGYNSTFSALANISPNKRAFIIY
jgi:hypothetical protein